jgi:hypothetical protein
LNTGNEIATNLFIFCRAVRLNLFLPDDLALFFLLAQFVLKGLELVLLEADEAGEEVLLELDLLLQFFLDIKILPLHFYVTAMTAGSFLNFKQSIKFCTAIRYKNTGTPNTNLHGLLLKGEKTFRLYGK